MNKLISGMPADEYHRIDAFSASGAKLLLQSPAHFAENKLKPRIQTPSMTFGTCVHTLILEPHLVESTIAVMPKVDRRTKAGKEAHAAFEATAEFKLIVDDETFDRAQAAADSVRRHPLYNDLLGAITPEVTAVWEEDGLLHKARFDAIVGHVIVDVKTTTDASAEGFGAAVATYKYHLQAAHYKIGFETCTSEKLNHFLFVAVESNAPHNVGIYQLDEEAILIGNFLREQAIGQYRRYLAGDIATTYSDHVRELSLPAYARKSLDIQGDWQPIQG